MESIVTSLFQRRIRDLRVVTVPQHPSQNSGLGVFGSFYKHYLISLGYLSAKQKGSFFHSFSKYLTTSTVLLGHTEHLSWTRCWGLNRAENRACVLHSSGEERHPTNPNLLHGLDNIGEWQSTVKISILNSSASRTVEDVGKMGPLCAVGGNVQWCKCYGEQYIFKKLKIEIPRDLSVHFWLYQKNWITHNSQKVEAIPVSIDELMDKKSGTWFSFKKEGHFDIRMNLKNIMLNEISQSQKEQYHMILFIWGF